MSRRIIAALAAAFVLSSYAASAQEKAAATPSVPKLDAQALLYKVRDTYRNLQDYHLERVLLVKEQRSDGNLANITELSLTLATQNARAAPEARLFPAVNVDRFRLATRTKQGEMLQVCDGRTCWSYTSLKNEYMVGNSFRDVNTSVGGSMLMAFHLFTFSMLEDGTVRNARIVREEEVQVGKERRTCDVIEGEIPATALRGPGGPNKPPSPASLGVFWLVSMLSLQGLTDEGRTTRYTASLDDNAAGVGEPTRVTLWIDRSASVIVRSQMAGQLYKGSATTGWAAEKVAVTVTDNFTTASVQAPPDDFFRFSPPEGAKEVPNAAARRIKKN